MSISLRSSVAALALAVFLIGSAAAQSTEPRLFRNSEGQTIEATFEGIEDGQVTIRRTSDGQSFTLPATSFSIEEAFWRRLKNFAAADGLSLNALIEQIDKGRQGNLSSAVRVYILERTAAGR